jgi:hypothetical protein
MLFFGCANATTEENSVDPSRSAAYHNQFQWSLHMQINSKLLKTWKITHVDQKEMYQNAIPYYNF